MAKGTTKTPGGASHTNTAGGKGGGAATGTNGKGTSKTPSTTVTNHDGARNGGKPPRS